MINPSCFFTNFRPLGALSGPREPWDGLRLEKECRLHQNSAPETNSKSHAEALCVFGTDRDKINI